MVGLDAHDLLAKKLNKAFAALGGQEIPGLEQLDPKKLLELQGNMEQFLDGMDDLSKSNPALAMLVGGQALHAMREMAQISSAAIDPSQGAQDFMRGMCGGGSFTPSFRTPPFVPPVMTPDQVLGALAGDGINFDPLGLNQCSSGVNTRSNAGCGVASPSSCGSSGNLELDTMNACGGAGGFFEDRVFALMIKIVEDFQKKIEERLQKLQEEAKKAEEGGGKKGGKGGMGGILGTVGKVAGGVFGGPVGAAVGGMAGEAIGGKMGGGGGGGAAGADGKGGGQESRNIEFEKIKFDMQKLSQMQQALSNILNTMDELAKSAIRHIKV
jgi:hypothetical protein